MKDSIKIGAFITGILLVFSSLIVSVYVELYFILMLFGIAMTCFSYLWILLSNSHKIVWTIILTLNCLIIYFQGSNITDYSFISFYERNKNEFEETRLVLSKYDCQIEVRMNKIISQKELEESDKQKLLDFYKDFGCVRIKKEKATNEIRIDLAIIIHSSKGYLYCENECDKGYKGKIKDNWYYYLK